MWFEHPLKNAYIGYVREPSADTILYLPFKEDLLDHSQTWLALTTSGTVTISDWAAYFNGSSYMYSKSFTQINQSNFTASLWFKNTSTTNSERVCLHQFRYYSWAYRGYAIWVTGSGWTWANLQNTYKNTSDWANSYISVNDWHHMVLVRDSTNQLSQFYFDGSPIPMQSAWNYPELYWWLWIGWWMRYNSTMWEYKWIGYMSEIIYENKVWTSTDVAKYYNGTKWNYWL